MSATTKWLQLCEYGEWICECQNTSGGSGFHNCLASGELIEPLIGSEWEGHYRCADCDLIILGIEKDGILQGQITGSAEGMEWNET